MIEQDEALSKKDSHGFADDEKLHDVLATVMLQPSSLSPCARSGHSTEAWLIDSEIVQSGGAE